MTDVAGETRERLDKHSERINDADRRITRVETKTENLKEQMGFVSDRIVSLQAMQNENHKETTDQLSDIRQAIGENEGHRSGMAASRAIHLGYGTIGVAVIGLLAKIAGLW